MIWMTEVDTSLKQHLTELFPDVHVIFSIPDIKENEEIYPTISITPLDLRINDKLRDYNSVTRDVDKEKGIVTRTDSPEYIDVPYQIDFWTSTPMLINTLTGTWTMEHPKISTILLKGTEEGEEYVAVMTFQGNNQFDKAKGEQSIFRRAYTYTITIQVPNGKQSVHKIATDVVIN